MIHSVKAPDLGPADAPLVCNFRRVGKDLKDTWEDVVRLLDTGNDERCVKTKCHVAARIPPLPLSVYLCVCASVCLSVCLSIW